MPEDLEAELAAFDHLSDDVLWLLANSTLSVTQQEKLANLNEMNQQRNLTSIEMQQQQTLLDAYERVVVRRAQALVLNLWMHFTLHRLKSLTAISFAHVMTAFSGGREK